MQPNTLQASIEKCFACAAACEHCATACLDESDVAGMKDCIKLDMDCADMCRFAASVMARGSAFAGDVCTLCAGICEACAAECGKHDHDHCQACAEACKQCAEACRAMMAGAEAG